jgi:ABC-type bacteriocin/lantibiotic exporter with double-glycine peptidase domain
MKPKHIVTAIIILIANSLAFGAAAGLTSGNPDPKDVTHATACGPIACFVAARAIGVSVSLDTMIDRCKWAPGRYTTLETVRTALSGMEQINCTPTRLTPEQLVAVLQTGQSAAILTIRKRSQNVDHALVAVRTQGDSIVMVDYPELSVVKSLGELSEIWDGAALVVTRQAVPNSTSILTRRGILAIAAFFASAAGMWLLSRRPKPGPQHLSGRPA